MSWRPRIVNTYHHHFECILGPLTIEINIFSQWFLGCATFGFNGQGPSVKQWNGSNESRTTKYTYMVGYSQDGYFFRKLSLFFQLHRLFFSTFGVESPASIDISCQSCRQGSAKLIFGPATS